MNLKELNSFKLSDAVTFHDKLNPKLWNGTKLRPEVREQLLKIAEDFLSELGVNDLDVKDITISGSNAAFSYTKHSDLDLHILVDMGNLPVDEVYRELFTAKKTIYNDTHDITIHKIPVELYVQDSRQPVVSLGEYSVMNDQWIKIPTKRRSDFDQTATKSKYEKLLGLIEIALKSRKYSKVKHIIDTIKRYRQAGLDKGGEFGPENLAYKMLRSQGYITKLYELRDKLHSEKLSFETMYQNIDEESNHWYDAGVKDAQRDAKLYPDRIVKKLNPRTRLKTMQDKQARHSEEVEQYSLGYRSIKQGVAEGLEQTPDQVRQTLNAWMEQDQQYTDPTRRAGTRRAGFQTKVWPYIQQNIKTILADKGEDGKGSYPASPYAAWLLVQHMDAYPQNQGEFLQQLAQSGLDPTDGKDGEGKLQFLKDRYEVNKWIAANANNPKYYYNSEPLPNPTVNVRNPAMFKDAGIVATSRKDALDNAIAAGNKLLVAAVQAKRAKTQPSYKQGVAEAFDTPLPITWEKGMHGDVDALAKLPDGSNLSIMFNKQDNIKPDDKTWMVEFYRNNSQEVTGEGDAQKVFSTVLVAIQQFITKYKPLKIYFSASKEMDPTINYGPDDVVPNPESRAKLYDRMVLRYAKSWGYKFFRADNGSSVIYQLSRIPKQKAVGENQTMQFAAEKTPPVSPYAGVKDNQYRGGISEAVSPKYVTRVDMTPIKDFESGMKTYYGTDDWHQSGLEKKDNFTQEMKGLYAGEPHRTALYASGNASKTRFLELNDPKTGQPVVYFDKKDIPRIRNTKTYVSVFDASRFKKLPTGEYFSGNPGKPLKQEEITDPFKYMTNNGWVVRVTDDIQKEFKKAQQLHKAGKIDHYGGENLTEASGYIPSEKEKNAPPFKTALTVDINPYTMKKGAKQFGWNISRAGIPPTAKVNGKI